jgi:hypothetical protein
VLKLRFGELVRRLVQLRRKKIEADAAEIGLDWSENAYLYEAKQSFGQENP